VTYDKTSAVIVTLLFTMSIIKLCFYVLQEQFRWWSQGRIYL